MDGSLKSELSLYGIAIVASLVAFGWYYRIWDARPEVPLSYADKGDSHFVYSQVQTIAETGWHQEAPRLSAPDTLKLYDYPLTAWFSFLLQRLVTLVVGDFGRSVNLYYMITFPLSACTSLFAMRRLRISGSLSVAASLIFAFLPYHFFRGQSHIALASYFMIPLVALMVIGLYRGRPLLFRQRADVRKLLLTTPRRFAVFSAVICALMSGSTSYYAFFTCILCGVAGLGALIERRSLAGLLNGLAAAGLVTVLFVVGLIPNILYWKEVGKNPSVAGRSVDDLPTYSLKLSSLVTPHPYHVLREAKALIRPGGLEPLPGLALYIEWYRADRVYYLGLASIAGLAILLGSLFLRRVPRGRMSVLWPISRLGLAVLLVGMPYGLGHLFGMIVTTKIRAYNRLSIFLAFFALAALALVVDRLRQRTSLGRLSERPWLAILTLVTVFCLYEQMPPGLRPDHAAQSAEFDAHREFYGAIEAALPPDSMVFQLPRMPFPETLVKVEHSKIPYRSYRHFKAYLHTDQLRWSGGAIAGRKTEQWQASVLSESVDTMVSALRDEGFTGLTMDRDGYDDHGAEIEQQLRDRLGPPELESLNGRLLFFQLKP